MPQPLGQLGLREASARRRSARTLAPSRPAFCHESKVSSFTTFQSIFTISLHRNNLITRYLLTHRIVARNILTASDATESLSPDHRLSRNRIRPAWTASPASMIFASGRRRRDEPDPDGPGALRSALAALVAYVRAAARGAARARAASRQARLRRRRAARLPAGDRPRCANPPGPSRRRRADLLDRRVEITGPDRPQDGHQRAQLRRERLHGGLRGLELADLGEPDRAARPI